ncbi:GntR family transcriptional regulator (plasmid) [Mycolicibacterium psychrotolerans]|uniref:GntR family transcriptional regulator n=1 Tax=Mycolicibacterium psychrotolerans TaxID=216929 RepID=UPI003D6789C2
MSEVRRDAAPLRAQVLRLLRDAIVAGEFAAGERLVERTLCDRFEVSRTVVRETLRQLESEGLVEILPQRGPVVATVTAEDAAALYEVREVLEALAGRAFAERATARQRAILDRRMADVEATLEKSDLSKVLAAKDAYYDALLDGAANPVLRNTLRGIHARTSLLRSLTLCAPGRTSDTIAELRAITTAATRGKAEAAWTASAEHVRSAAGIARGILLGPADKA